MSSTQSPRRRPPPSTIPGFDTNDEIEADDLFWMAAYLKGYAPADFQPKTISDFKGKGITESVQQKRWDAWNSTRNGNITTVINHRKLLLKKEAQAAQVQMLKEQQHRGQPQHGTDVSSRVQSDVSSSAASPTLAAALMAKRQYAEMHNDRASDLQRIREIRKAQERDRVEQIYDNISMRNFLYYRDRELQEQMARKRDLERQQKLEEERQAREERKKNLLLEQDHQLHFLQLKRNHMDTLLQRRNQHRNEVCSALQNKRTNRKQSTAANKLRIDDSSEQYLSTKIKHTEFVAVKGQSKKEDVKKRAQQDSYKRKEHAHEVLQRSKEILQQRRNQFEEKIMQEEAKSSYNKEHVDNVRKAVINNAQQKRNDKTNSAIQRFEKTNQEQKDTISRKVLDKDFNSQLQRAKNEEERILKVEDMHLISDRKKETIARLNREMELVEEGKREGINSKYWRMYENENLKVAAQADYSARKQNSTVAIVPVPPKAPPSKSARKRQQAGPEEAAGSNNGGPVEVSITDELL